MTQTTEQLLAERGKTHGEYTDHARCTQNIMRALMVEKNWETLSDIQKESLHMFAHKMGRIATGNPDIHDHWDDIAGYAKLVSDRIPKDTETAAMQSFSRSQVAATVAGLVAESKNCYPRSATHAEYESYKKKWLRPEDDHPSMTVSELYDPVQGEDGRYKMFAHYVEKFGA